MSVTAQLKCLQQLNLTFTAEKIISLRSR